MNALLEVFTTPHHPADFAAALVRRGARTLPPPAVEPPPTPAPDGSEATVVRFAASDAWVVATGDTPILEAAESAGLEPRFGCRRGVCHRCTAPLVDGTVRDLRDGRTTGAGGHVRVCVSVPVTDVVVDL